MELSVRIERWPLAGAFTISRGTKTEAVVVVAELSDGTHRGRGESVPYARYGETPDGIVAAIEAMRPALRRGLTRADLPKALPVMHSIVLTGTLTPRLPRARCMNWPALWRRSHGSRPIRSRSPRLRPWRKPRSGRRAGPCSRSSSAQATTMVGG